MYIGYSGNNRKGYEIKGILKSIDDILDSKEGMKICIAGIGNLGKALVNFFSIRSFLFPIAVNRSIYATRCSRNGNNKLR